jgi:RimJ/RimL family protein N-acetyltransferase
VLRPLLPSDFEAVHGFSSDPEVCRFMQWGPNTEEQTRAFIESTLANQETSPKITYDFVIVLAKTSQVIGNFTLRLGKADSQLGEIGYVLAREAWGKGYASEAADLVIKFGFTDLSLHKISATCEPLNFASAKVLQKAGLRFEGFLHKHFFIKGQWRDSLLFGCVREERLANMQERRSAQRVLGSGDVTAVPLSEYPRVSMAPLTPAFAGGSVQHFFMRSGAKIGPLTNVLDEYLIVLQGSLKSGDKTLEKGAVLHCPGAVRQGPHEALTEVDLLSIRLGPPGETG